MFALLLSFPLLCLQASGPDLPEALREETTVVAAWVTAQDLQASLEQRQQASALIVTQLATLPPAEQLPFLLAATGAGLLATDLRPIYRQLDSSWELFETRLIESLLLPLPANQDLVRGVLLATGELACSNVELIESVAVFLDRQNFAADARHALENITGRQFAGHAEFQAWWQTASTQDREVWLETAFQQSKAEELAHWRMLLGNGTDILTILDGLQHSRQEINELSLAALKIYDFAGADAETKAAISAAFLDALKNEKVLVQRKALLELVPRFLTGYEALNPLLRALEYGHASEKQPAARMLKQIQPPEVAWEGVLRGLDGVYPENAEDPVGAENVRIALWASLSFLSTNGGAPDLVAVELRLRQALAVENHKDVRSHIYSAIGTIAGEDFLPALEAIVVDMQAPTPDRTDALIAMTSIAQRLDKPESLSILLPQLLADAQVQIRRQAIESLNLLALPGTPKLLVERLSRESEAFLQKRILAALVGARSPEVLEPLLVFKPTEALQADYRRALVAQIGNDLAAFQRVFAYFETQADSFFQLDLEFRVARSFPLDGLSEADQKEVNRKHAIAVSRYLLRFGVQNGNSGFAEDAVVRLRDWIAAEPENGLWLDFLVDLQLDRDQVAEALEVLPKLLAIKDYPLARKWELGLYALRNAAARQMLVEGRQLFDQLDSLGPMPPEWQTYAEQLREHFPALPQPPAEEESLQPPATEVPSVEPTGDGEKAAKPPEQQGSMEAGVEAEGSAVQEAPKMKTSPPEM